VLNTSCPPRVTLDDFDTSGMTWDYLERMREVTSMKIVVKGIVTREDASSAEDAGADAFYVSNHGGRTEASGWGALESLPEVVEAANGRVPVMVDSGFRHGTDIFKALALGADAVCIGRAYIWGLAAFGQAGVEKVLEMLKAELRMVMGHPKSMRGAPSGTLARIAYEYNRANMSTVRLPTIPAAIAKHALTVSNCSRVRRSPAINAATT